MFRRDVLELLKQQAMSAHQLADVLQCPLKEIHQDLEHLHRSLKRMPLKLEVEPAQCRKCGFRFGAEKLTRPSKCPVCKATWITEPRLRVVAA